MTFKVKDLMIKVLPDSGLLADFPADCGGDTYCGPGGSGCACSNQCSGSGSKFTDWIEWAINPADLAGLKEELKRALARVEEQERVIGEDMRPQTLGDVEQLEEKLTAALEELRNYRSELERKETHR